MNIAVCFFLVNPILGMLIVPKLIFRDRRQKYAYSLLFGAFFGYMSYFINPSPTIDLARYFQKMEMLSHFSFADFISYYDLSAKLDLSNWFLFFLSKFENVHLLPLIAMTFVYTSILYMILDNKENKHLSNKIVALQILIVVAFLSFPGISSNIRNISAFVFFMLGFYLETYHKSYRKSIIIYILAAMIHKTVVILILLRILSYVVLKLKNKKLFIVISTVFITCTVFIVIVYQLVHLLPITLPFTSLINKAYTYATGFGSSDSYMLYIQGSLFMKIQKAFYLCINLLFMYLFYKNGYLKKLLSFEKKQENQFLLFYFFNLVLTLGTMPIILPVYWRFSFISVIFSWCVVNTKTIKKQILIVAILILVFGGFLYQILLIGQYTDFITFVTKIITNNYFSIFIGGN
ncbi:EpsG family protein [Enterococcus durans]|uniref:EpsG family protein n=1 Tax=Enterococcus durans TaxID=53345 RepID=A0A367CC99_9ENTE|nr:EpsG family protein [Enterococcus durans]RCA10124.1 hypothetical protein EA71_00855 [Enterococcus durans]